MYQATCHRRFDGDVGDGWKSDADENAVINMPCFVESTINIDLPDDLCPFYFSSCSSVTVTIRCLVDQTNSFAQRSIIAI